MRRALTALALLLASCGPNYATDARWTFRWDLDGATLTDVWTHRLTSCRESVRLPENVAALRQKSLLRACHRRCAEDLDCALRCGRRAEARGERCDERRRLRPRPPWIRLH